MRKIEKNSATARDYPMQSKKARLDTGALSAKTKNGSILSTTKKSSLL